MLEKGITFFFAIVLNNDFIQHVIAFDQNLSEKNILLQEKIFLKNRKGFRYLDLFFLKAKKNRDKL